MGKRLITEKKRYYLLIHVIILSIFAFVFPATAEIKVFEKETTWKAAKNQSQEQAESLAIMEAQRKAIEEAGTFISTLTVVKDFRLDKDEITQLASGILQTKTLGVPSLFTCDDTFCVRVKTYIQVDTSVLDRQIEVFMRDKGALKREEEALKKVRELQEQLANLKGTEIKRLEELNAQALAMERDRDRQRLLREEQTLKAKGDLSRVEADRLAKEREMQEKINRTLAEQEKAKREEAAALRAEQDRIKRAQLENEQRWNDLARKAKLAQDQWVVIDNNLSLKVVSEANDLKKEIANLKSRLDYQYGENIKNLKAAYVQQRNLTTAKLPPEPAPKDAFETTNEYNQRIATYDRQVKEAKRSNLTALERLNKEENLKLAEAVEDYLGQQIRVLTPFIKRLQDLQNLKFTLAEGGSMVVELGEPDADNNRFPLRLQYQGKSWSVWWTYTDRNSARDFYRTRTYLKAEGIFQIEEATKLVPKFTAARVTHLGTKESQEFNLEIPKVLTEINQFRNMQQEIEIAKKASKDASFWLAQKEVGKDSRFIAFEGGIVVDTKSNLMWAAQDNGKNIDWRKARSYCENYQGGGYKDWRMPTQTELAGLYDKTQTYEPDCGTGDVHLTGLIRLSCSWAWATEINDSEAAVFGFFNGNRLWFLQSYNVDTRALPVRFYK